MPQRQGLGVPQHLTDGAADDDALTQWAAVGLHRFRGRGRRALHRAGRQQMPRTFAGVGMGRMLVIDGEFVAHAAVGDPLPIRGDLDQGDHGAAAGWVDPQPEMLVGNRQTLDGLPPAGLRTRCEPVGSPPQRPHTSSPPTHRVTVVLHKGRHLSTVCVKHPHCQAHRLLEVHGDDIGSVVRQRIPHHHRLRGSSDRPGEQLQCPRTRGGAQLPGIPPPGEQVEVHLIGLATGDRVVVCAPGQLHPGLGQRRFGVPRSAQQAGEHREPFRAEHRVLGSAIGLLGVDVGDVLAGVDRVHIPGLRRGRSSAFGEFRAHGGEEVRRNRADKPRPGVAGVPVVVDIGDPGVRRGVVRTDRQQHIAGQRHRLQFGEQVVGGVLGLGQRG